MPPVPAAKISPERAQQIRDLLSNPLLEETIADVERGAVLGWRAADTATEREDLWYLVKAVEHLRGRFQHLANLLADAEAATPERRRQAMKEGY